MGLVLSLAAGAIILTQALGAVEAIRSLMEELGDRAGLSPAVLDPVLKTVGIAVLTRVAGGGMPGCERERDRGLCGDCGAVMALYVALPLMRAVLDTVGGLL